jgi:hypothetical protein
MARKPEKKRIKKLKTFLFKHLWDIGTLLKYKSIIKTELKIIVFLKGMLLHKYLVKTNCLIAM